MCCLWVRTHGIQYYFWLNSKENPMELWLDLFFFFFNHVVGQVTTLLFCIEHLKMLLFVVCEMRLTANVFLCVPFTRIIRNWVIFF